MSLIESFTIVLDVTSLYIDTYIYPAMITVFMKACRTYNRVNDYCVHLYNTNEGVRTVVDETQYKICQAYSFMINRRMEPRDPIWFSSSWLTPNDHSLTRYYNYNEEYAGFFTQYFCNDLFDFHKYSYSGYAVRYLQTVSNDYVQRKSFALYPLLVIKTLTPSNCAFYSVRRARNCLDPFVYKKSAAKFISIEYTHPDMNEAIEIKLDDGFYMSGNELFTPTFVLRLLEYQSISYFFDNRYEIRILDSECSMIDFGFKTHLLLTADGYIMVDDDVDIDGDGYAGSCDEDSEETPLFIDNSLGSLYTPSEFGYRR